MKLKFIMTFIVSMVASYAFAGTDHGAQLMMKDAHIRATAPNAGATAGYIMIHNHGNHADRLIGVRADFARKSEIHEMKMVGDVMKMRPLEDGIIIPAGGMAMLEKGGDHLMFMGLSSQVKMHEAYNITLIFEKAGEVVVSFDAIPLAGGKSKAHKHDTHKHE